MEMIELGKYVFWNDILLGFDIYTKYPTKMPYKNSRFFYDYFNDIFTRKHPLKFKIVHLILSKEEQEFLKSLNYD